MVTGVITRITTAILVIPLALNAVVHSHHNVQDVRTLNLPTKLESSPSSAISLLDQLARFLNAVMDNISSGTTIQMTMETILVNASTVILPARNV